VLRILAKLTARAADVDVKRGTITCLAESKEEKRSLIVVHRGEFSSFIGRVPSASVSVPSSSSAAAWLA
jgi:hypothetical protein